MILYKNVDECIELASLSKKNGDTSGALSIIKIGLEQLGNKIALLVCATNYCMALNDILQTEKYLLESLKLRPEDANILTFLGRCALQQKRYSEAIDFGKRAVFFRGLSIDALLIIADSFNFKGEWKESVAHYKEVLKLDPIHKTALYGLARSLYDLNEKTEAKSTYQRLKKLDVNDPFSDWGLSLLLLEAGEYKKGWDLYESRVALAVYKHWIRPTIKMKASMTSAF